VVVICAGGDLEEEMSQVKAADSVLKSSNGTTISPVLPTCAFLVIYSMMYATEFDASFYQAAYLNAAKRRRHLLEEENIPIDYSTCDALCHVTPVFFYEQTDVCADESEVLGGNHIVFNPCPSSNNWTLLHAYIRCPLSV